MDYQTKGASPLKEELPEILQAAHLSDATRSLMYFASDISLDLELWFESRKLLERIAARFDITDVRDVHYNNLALCLLNLGSNEAVLVYYGKSLELNPANSSSVRGMALTLHELGRDAEALEYASRWRLLRPEDTDAFELLTELQQ